MKLVYIAHGWHLGVYKSPLINDPPQAWDFGPVIPTLYNALKHYGNDPITGPVLQEVQLSTHTADSVVPPPAPFALPAESATCEFLKTMWTAYGDFTAAHLTTLTNADGTPWSETWKEKGAIYRNGVDIPEALIQSHYERLNAYVTATAAAAASPVAGGGVMAGG